MQDTREEILAMLRRREVETINNINNINDTIDINDTNDMASFLLEGKRANFVAAALAVGGETQESGQEAEGVKEIAKPKTLAEERSRRQEQGKWISQASIDYIKISLWKPVPNDPHSFKLKYSFKTVGNNDLAYNNYSILLTRNRFDFAGNVKKKWADYATEGSMYQGIVAAMKNLGDSRMYAGKAQATRKFSTGIQKIPMEPHTASWLYYDEEDDAWVINIQHHDFTCIHAVPRTIWEEQIKKWIQDYAIQVESKRARHVPPFYTGVERY